MFLDSNDLIVQKGGDGGDSAQRMGFYWSAARIAQLLNVPFNVDPNGLIRNTIQYNNPADCSRDQTRPIIIMSGLYNLSESTLEALKPKGLIGRYQNGDFASPENWNEYRRACSESPSILGDLFALGDAMTRCYQAGKNQDDVGDDINTLLTLTYFYLVKPTFLSKQALKYYLNHRPQNFGNSLLNESDPVMGALSWYFRPAMGGNPELAEMWRPIIAKLREIL